MQDKKAIRKNFEGVVLGSYDAGVNLDVFVDTFADHVELFRFLSEVDCMDATLTKEGVQFLDAYYGIDVIIGLIQREISDGVYYKYRTAKDLRAWLERGGYPEGEIL